MTIGDLLGKLKGEKSEVPEFLAIELTDEVVQAAVWKVSEGKTELVTTGAPVEWDGDENSTSELLSAADATVSSALEGLEKEPDQVIFGIESSWVEDGKIVSSKLTLIKQICKELELKPLGFVEIIDSVIRFLKMQEGTPATSLMIQVFNSEIIVTLVRLGHIEAREVVGRGDDIASDVEEALTAFKKFDNLPSRILVFNSMHSLDDLVQELVSYDWQKNFKFLHVPRVETLPKDIVIRSISLGGGSEVARSIGFEIADETDETKVAQKDEESNVSSTQLGQPNPLPPEEEIGSADDFGFAQTLDSSLKELDSNPPQVEVPQVMTENKPSPTPPKLPPLPKFNFKLPSIKFSYNHFRHPFVLVIIFITILIGSYFSFIWFVPKATLTIQVVPRETNELVEITLSPGVSSVNPDSAIVPAELITHQISGEDSIETTGKKIIGDPAKGEVTIYNRTSLPKTLSAGTVITANSLKFTLDESVTIASKSAGSDYVDVPGKATVPVTASAIGENSNLPANTEFVIANYSKDTYVAKNDTAFKGGTSKEIRVVSESDKTNLVKSLTARLVTEAQAELQAKAEPGTGIYLLIKSVKLVSENYNVKVGGEADSLIGKLDITLSAIKYRTTDVENLVSAAISRTIPPGYQKTLDAPTVEIGEVISEKDQEVTTKAKVIVKLLPMVDINTYTSSVRGSSLKNLDNLFSSIPGYQATKVAFSPSWLPVRFQSIPRNTDNITIKLVSQ